MIPENHKFVVITAFGALVDINVEAKPHKINGSSGVLEYGASSLLITQSSVGNGNYESAAQDNSTDGWFGYHGVCEIQSSAGAISGTAELRLIDIEDSTRESDADKSLLLAIVEIISSSSPARMYFSTDDPK